MRVQCNSNSNGTKRLRTINTKKKKYIGIDDWANQRVVREDHNLYVECMSHLCQFIVSN